MARDLIASKSEKFDAGAFKDRYSTELRKLIDRKAKGKTPIAKRGKSSGGSTGGDNVIDLMSALKKSLADSGGSRKRSTKAPAKSSGKSSAKKSKAGSSPSRKAS